MYRYNLKPGINCFYYLVLFVVFIPLFGQPAPVSLPPWESLLDNTIVVQTCEDPIRGFPGVRLFFIVTAPQELIWESLTNSARGRDVHSQFRGLEVLEKDFEHEIIHYEISLLFRPFSYTLRRNFNHNNRRVDWVMIDGDFEYIRGYWQVKNTPRSGTYLLVYENYVDTGFYIPGWIKQLIQKGETKKMASATRASLEAN